MKKWQHSRNYRRIRQTDGSVKNIITVDGIDVEVTDEVFLAYSQAERRERYQLEDQKKGRVLSLEQLQEDNMHLEFLTTDSVESAEEIVIAQETEKKRNELLNKLNDLMQRLTAEEYKLIYALYFEGVSARELARINNVSDMAIRKKRDRILQKLKNFYANVDIQGSHPLVFSGGQ